MSKKLKSLMAIGLLVLFGMGIMVPLVASTEYTPSAVSGGYVGVTNPDDTLWGGGTTPPPPDPQPPLPPQT